MLLEPIYLLMVTGLVWAADRVALVPSTTGLDQQREQEQGGKDSTLARVWLATSYAWVRPGRVGGRQAAKYRGTGVRLESYLG